MKIKAGVKFEIGKIKIDSFQDKHTEKDKDYIEDRKTLIWSTNPKPCTKANINKQIDDQLAHLKKRFDKLSDYVEGSGWIIYRWHYIFVECLTIMKYHQSEQKNNGERTTVLEPAIPPPLKI